VLTKEKRNKEQREKQDSSRTKEKKTKLELEYSNNKDEKGEKGAKKHYYPDKLLSPCSRKRSQSKRRDRCFNFKRLTRFRLKRWPTPSFFIF
jgi:hypothetical protein